jgi:hypothetical protein
MGELCSDACDQVAPGEWPLRESSWAGIRVKDACEQLPVPVTSVPSGNGCSGNWDELEFIAQHELVTDGESVSIRQQDVRRGQRPVVLEESGKLNEMINKGEITKRKIV